MSDRVFLIETHYKKRDMFLERSTISTYLMKTNSFKFARNQRQNLEIERDPFLRFMVTGDFLLCSAPFIFIRHVTVQ
ncbi:MAG: hypothetical protein C0610_07080 [Desulfobacteraceae bacterium]|nr:MAG: hypothetical protein C0610_07080 [Desulfobacteraceae bacterium]